MVLGMSLQTFTVLHVIISLVGIGSGFVVAAGMLKANPLPLWTAVFLVSTVLTSATGFLFPFVKLMPSHIVGVISLLVLAVSIVALYSMHLDGAWRWIYVVTAVVALYLNTFVLVVQSFLKIPPLTALAPTGTEPPFAVAQLVVLIGFVVLGYLAVRKFHPGVRVPAPSAI
jgi:hypothetical protein